MLNRHRYVSIYPSYVQVTFSLKESNENGAILKNFLHQQGIEKIRKQLELYLKHLKEGMITFPARIILPRLLGERLTNSK